MRGHAHSCLLLVVASLVCILLIKTQSSRAVPIERDGSNRGNRGRPASELDGELTNAAALRSPDRCSRGVCQNKEKICEVICKNNPSEGGKFCNCDTYALRASSPTTFTDCNKLLHKRRR